MTVMRFCSILPDKCWESRPMLKLRKSAFCHFSSPVLFQPTISYSLLYNSEIYGVEIMQLYKKNVKEKKRKIICCSRSARVPTPRLVVTIECEVPQCFPCLLFKYCCKKANFLNTVVSPRLMSWMCSFKPWRYVKRLEADPFLPQETWEIRRLRSSAFVQAHNMNYNIDNMNVIVNISIFLTRIHAIINFSNVYLKCYDILYSPVAKIEARDRWWRPGLVNIKDVTLFRPFS
jgi:hypothetical protein